MVSSPVINPSSATLAATKRRGPPVSTVPYSYRADPAVPAFPDDRPIIVFDGNCVLCSRFAQFVLRVDRKRHFRLMAAQTATGAALYRHYGLDPVNYETNVLIEDGRAWFKSEGTIRMFEKLGFPWRLMAIGRVLPLGPRDRLYSFIACNRLVWFGVRKTCFLRDPAQAGRFIE
jgi:predicted DCC family thiol-disulfide oxidoreductase YuxK